MAKTHDLHGNAPDKSSVALLMIDTINDLEFPESDQILKPALAMAKCLSSWSVGRRPRAFP